MPPLLSALPVACALVRGRQLAAAAMAAAVPAVASAPVVTPQAPATPQAAGPAHELGGQEGDAVSYTHLRAHETSAHL
eukprot:11534327-Alexandrium_andersonii.AAC.1